MGGLLRYLLNLDVLGEEDEYESEQRHSMD